MESSQPMHENGFNWSLVCRKLRVLIFLITSLLPSITQAQTDESGIRNAETPKMNTWADTGYITDLLKQAAQLHPLNADSAARLYREILIKSRAIGYHYGIIKSLNNLGAYFHSRREYDKSISLYAEAIQSFSEADSAIIRSSIYYNIGLSYTKTGQTDQALKAHHMALRQLPNEVVGTELLPKIYTELGLVYQYRGEYERAAYYYFLILNSQSPQGQRSYSYVAETYNRLAVILFQFRMFEQALPYFDIAESIARSFKDTGLISKIMGNKAALYSETGDKVKAEKLYSRVYELSGNGGYQGVRMTAAYNISKMLAREERTAEAISYAEEARNIALAIHDQDGYINAQYALAFALAGNGDLKQAELLLLKSIEEVNNKKLAGNTSNPYDVLAAIYAATGRYKLAYEYARKYTQVNDSLRGTSNAIAVSTLESQYQIAKKDKDLIQKQLQINMQQSMLREKNLWVGGISLVAILLTTTLIAISRSYRHKQKLQHAAMNNLRQEQELSQLKALIRGEEQERKRIAGALHDGIASQLYAVKMNLCTLQSRESGVLKTRELNEVLVQLEDAGKDLRRTAHNLMPELLLQEGLAPAVSRLCVQTEKSTHISVEFLILGSIPRLDASIELTLYRMIQELVHNILKHAGATQIFIQLGCENGLLNITVEDNGVGLEEHSEKDQHGMGLSTMTQRVRTLGGHVDIQALKNKGTAVYLEFDLHFLIPADKSQANH